MRESYSPHVTARIVLAAAIFATTPVSSAMIVTSGDKTKANDKVKTSHMAGEEATVMLKRYSL